MSIWTVCTTATATATTLAVAIAITGCDGGEGSDPADSADPTDTDDDGGDGSGSEGEAVYRQRVDDGNVFACATCHALWEPADDGLRRPGHPLGDAAARPSFKHAAVADLRGAVNSCLTEWMNAEPWSADDPRWLALSSFLEDIAPAEADPLAFEIVPPPADLTGGDAAAGEAAFDATCAACHGVGGGGTELAPPVAGRALDPSYVAQRVRSSGRSDSSVYDGLTGGIMPFWAADRLSDAELRDIVAWLQDSEPAPMPVDDDGGSDDGGDPSTGDDGGGTDDGGPTGGCASTHPRVGQTAILQEAFHDVGGTAEILDDCTIEIRDFTYDATGIDVRLYGGLGGDYDGGFAMGDDLLRDEPYAGETLTFTLPPGYTLDDLDGVSVWCVTVGIDFGSGMFQ